MAGRVWDQFLTEQDKHHVDGRGRRPVGFGEQPALLLIDLYRNVFGDRPEPLLEAIKTWPSSCGPKAWESLQHTQELLQTAREVGIPVIHVTMLDDDQSGILGWSEAKRRDQPRSRPGDPSAADRRRRRCDIVDEVAPIEGEAVLRKAAPSAFWGTPLAAHLNYLGTDTIIVCGESTSGCVRASVVEGCTYRYRMIVVEECVFDRHESAHAMNLFDMHQKYADVVALTDVVHYLQDWKAGRDSDASSLFAEHGSKVRVPVM
jgi:maleamate amidohydrolase